MYGTRIGVNSVFDRLEAVEARYEKLNELLMDPEVLNDPKNYVIIQKNSPI